MGVFGRSPPAGVFVVIFLVGGLLTLFESCLRANVPHSVYSSSSSLSLILSSPSSGKVPSVTVYVSNVNGDDSASGDANQPLATIAGAQVRLRALKAANPGKIMNFSVLLRGGTYYIPQTLEFTAADSGWAEAPVVYSSYPGERAVLSGGAPVRNWTRSNSTGMYYANVPGMSARQIYSRAPLSQQPEPNRFPASSYFQVTGYNFSGSCAGTANAKGAGSLAAVVLTVPAGSLTPTMADALGGAELVILKTFSETRLRVARVAITGPNQITVYPGGPSALLEGCNYSWVQPGAWSQPFRAYFENDFQFFADPADFGSRPGSYALANSSIYFMARANDAVDSGGVVIPRLERLAVLSGVQNIVFRNLDFRHTTWVNPNMNGYIGGQAGFSSFCAGDCAIPAAITIRAGGGMPAANIQITGSVIAQSGGHGIAVLDKSARILLDGNMISEIAASGIVIGTFGYAVSDATESLMITNNRIAWIGRMYDGVGILAGFTRNTQIANNSISHVSYSGISVGWFGQGGLGGSDSLILNNDVSFTNKLFSDGAGIYAMEGTSGDHINGNYVHDIQSSEPGFATNLRLGLYLDNLATNVMAENNQLRNLTSGLFLQTEENYVATRNIVKTLNMFNVTTPVPIAYDASNRVEISLNTLNRAIMAGSGAKGAVAGSP